jgi:endonuclease YncB( thermonuclease family)
LIASTLLVATVIGIADGDTLLAETPGKQQVLVRLAAIDAPDFGQPYAEKARASLVKLCLNKRASFKPVTSDGEGRMVADVKCAGKDASAHQVRNGYAWVYDRYSQDHADLYELEEAARNARRGLWMDSFPIPPWKWRITRDEEQRNET